MNRGSLSPNRGDLSPERGKPSVSRREGTGRRLKVTGSRRGVTEDPGLSPLDSPPRLVQGRHHLLEEPQRDLLGLRGFLEEDEGGKRLLVVVP